MDIQKRNKERDVSIDVTRSLAIIIMVAANMAIIAEGHAPWIFRLISSSAAPIFIILACMMVTLGLNKGHAFSSVLIKGLYLILVAILLDLSTGTFPLKHMDVLYLIGILIVMAQIIGQLPTPVLLVMGGICLMIAPLLQFKFGYYHSEPLELSSLTLLKSLAHHYFISGWFPLFPWASLCFFSVILGKLRYNKGRIKSFAQQEYVLIAILLIFVGALTNFVFQEVPLVRERYIELFYPPTASFMIFSMGLVLGLICLMDFIGPISWFAVIYPLGEASLFMYFFHIIVIYHLIVPMGTINFGWRYVLYYLIFISSMILIGFMLRTLRNTVFYRKVRQFLKR